MFALTGCIKMDMDMKLSSNEKMSGTMIVAFQKSLLQMMGQSEADFLKEMKSDSSDVPKGAKVSDYNTKEWIGQKIEFKDIPASEFSKVAGNAKDAASAGGSTSPGDDMKLVKNKSGNWEFSGTLDLSSSDITGAAKSGGSAGGPDMSAFMKSLDFRIKMTFPGDIISVDKFAKKSGKSVEWKPKVGQKVVMKVVAKPR